MVKFRYQQGSVLKHVVAHALDSLVAAFGEEVILGLVSTKDVERLDSQKLCEALLAFCSSYKIDGFRAALSVSLNVHAQSVAPKLATAVYKALHGGAAPDVVVGPSRGRCSRPTRTSAPSAPSLMLYCYQRGSRDQWRDER